MQCVNERDVGVVIVVALKIARVVEISTGEGHTLSSSTTNNNKR